MCCRRRVPGHELLSPQRAFGRPIEAGMARQIQFSIDFEF
jgi:hypothetical protein